MRNRYPGICYRCGSRVEVGDGHFERYKGGWRTQHARCAITCRGVSSDPPINNWVKKTPNKSEKNIVS